MASRLLWRPSATLLNIPFAGAPSCARNLSAAVRNTSRLTATSNDCSRQLGTLRRPNPAHFQTRTLRRSSGAPIPPPKRRLRPGERDNAGPPASAAQQPVFYPLPTPSQSLFQSPPSSFPITGEFYPSQSSPSLPAELPPDVSDAVITRKSPAAPLVARDSFVVVRQLEMMNVFLGFEQANRYRILDPNGVPVGFVAEEQGFLARVVMRQLFRTHRPVDATVFDAEGNIVLKIYRPFSFINSRMTVYDADGREIGEVHQEWHLLRRKYNLFVNRSQFAAVDAPFLSWDFNLCGPDGEVLGAVNRNFSGFAREIFTDTGQYVLRTGASLGQLGLSAPSRHLSLDERAVVLACALEIDIDYFSRTSGGGFPLFPFMIMGGSEII